MSVHYDDPNTREVYNPRTPMRGKSKAFIQTKVRGLCIPTLPSDVTKRILYMRFRCLNIGFIKNIIIVKKPHTSSAFINISRWFDNERAINVLEFLEKDEPIYICNTFPEYLKCYVLKKKEKNHNNIK